MPSVELTHHEARTGDLPFVCMVCGQAGHVYRRTVLSYSPWWIYLGIPLGVLPYFVLALFLNRRARLLAPLCELHQYHWSWRQLAATAWLLLSGGLFGVAVLLLVSLVEADSASPAGWKARAALVVLILLLVAYAGLLSWPITALLLKYSGVHASPITPLSITLAPVADEFVEALRVHRQDRRPNLDRAFCEG